MELIVFKQLGIAILLAGLVGLEREKHSQEADTQSFAGIRTFLLFGLFGALAQILASFSVWVTVALIIGFFGFMAAAYVSAAIATKKIGLTSEFAAVVVFLIGFLTMMGDNIIATLITLFLVFILQFKESLHNWVRNVSRAELISTLEFILIAFVVLPILPNQNFGPYGFFNPYVIWLMIVLISAISFLSYIAIRAFGSKKGIFLTGFLGGILSSTALVMSFSEHSKQNRHIVYPYVVAILIASSAMLFRVLVIIGIINFDLLSGVLLPFLAMGVTGLIFSALFYFRKSSDGVSEDLDKQTTSLKNPFRLWPAVKFGAFFAGVLLVASYARDLFGNSGLYVTTFLSATLDVDPIVVSLGNLARETLSYNVAVAALTLAVMTNTLIKGFWFLILGARAVALRILMVFLFMVLAGLVTLVLF